MNTECRLFRTLLRKQFREQHAFLHQSARTGKQRTAVGTCLFGALYLVLTLVIMGSFASLAWPLGQVLLSLAQAPLYFLVMELLSVIVSVLAGAFSGYSTLFQAKDNELLLALPIPPSMIFAVRLCGLYGLCLFYLLLVWVPAEVIYTILTPHPWGGLLSALPMALLLAGVAAVLAAVLGWGVAVLTERAGRYRTLVITVSSLGFVALYYLGYGKLGEILERQLSAAANGTEHRTLSGIGALLGSAACGNLFALLLLALAWMVLCALLGKALSRPYLDLMTTHRGEAKRATAAPARQQSVQRALLRRELLHLGGSAAYLLNCAMGTFGLFVLGGAALYKANDLRALAAQLPSAEWGAVFAAFLVAMIAGTNFLTAPSVSLEGESLWLIQSLPVTSWQVLRAKLELHLLLTIPPALFCLVCVQLVLQFPVGTFLLAVLFVLLFVVGSASLGLILGVRMPSFHWTSEAVVIKQSPFCLLAVFGSWAAGVGLFAGVMALIVAGCPALLALAAASLLLALAGAGEVWWVKNHSK